MMIKRTMVKALEAMAQQFPVVAVMGPRQSGKTTLTKETFPHYAYVSMEDLDTRRAAQEDPRGFFVTYAAREGLIIDEIQEAPDLLSYMQGIVDREYRPGFFIITGSQHFLMHEKISQTLAGRIALLTLLPLSVSELKGAGMLQDNLGELLLKGGYPRLYVQPIDRQVWYSNYISTYIEKDVRQVLRITDVVAFQRFIQLCAARVGNIINYAELARDADISPNTAKSWISILESSYIIKLLTPYYKNFSKRLIKNPKLYFYDTALVCALLGIKTAEELLMHPIKGAIFESFIISEMYKYNYNHNAVPHLFFWRDVQGHEIDVLIETRLDEVVPVEIKSGMTMSQDFFKGLIDWKEISGSDVQSYAVYGGDEDMVRKHGQLVSWRHLDDTLKKIYVR